MGPIYRTNPWKGGGRQSTYHNEYFDDGDVIRKVKVHLFKFFDGRENSWERDEREVERWKRDDPGMPDWLKRLLG